ncbi:plasmid mobilization protein [Gordonia westfalica]|uniref:Uncharacterized protein n=1 Tax=Gordonia westfalica TaxID=158898 RepID=A0A1H2JSM7_9ACTN|nr:hypothetical protein [Gordonia westfalica]SDU59420.1 hypothetical protein SAMN04488548_1342462 [Gordonia westfalica]
MSEPDDVLRDAITDAQEIEDHPDRAIRDDVTVARPNRARGRVLQVRLTDDEYTEVEKEAETRGLPVSTYARDVLLRRHDRSLPETGIVTLPSGEAVTLEVFLEVLLLSRQAGIPGLASSEQKLRAMLGEEDDKHKQRRADFVREVGDTIAGVRSLTEMLRDTRLAQGMDVGHSATTVPGVAAEEAAEATSEQRTHQSAD